MVGRRSLIRYQMSSAVVPKQSPWYASVGGRESPQNRHLKMKLTLKCTMVSYSTLLACNIRKRLYPLVAQVPRNCGGTCSNLLALVALACSPLYLNHLSPLLVSKWCCCHCTNCAVCQDSSPNVRVMIQSLRRPWSVYIYEYGCAGPLSAVGRPLSSN